MYEHETSSNGLNAALSMTKFFSDIKLAAKQNPYKTAILFINNFEDFVFSDSYHSGYKQAKTQLSREMDKAISDDINILVVGSTREEYAEYIPMFIKDFSQNIVVDSPAYNKKSRKDVITNILAKESLPLAYRTRAEKEDLINKLVKLTEYFSYVQIKNLISKTEQIMLEREKTKAGIGEFIEAYLQEITGRTSQPDMPDYNKRATTSHECGHATNLEIMNKLYEQKGEPWYKSRDVKFITLDPRGDFLGAVFEGKGENIDYPFEAMFSDLVCSYGGHSCEKYFFNMDGSSGISQDLAQATSAAKRAIEYFGLGYNTGKISNAAGINSGKYQENVYSDLNVLLTNAQIVSDLITEGYKDFNIWFTEKYSKLIGSDNCMIDGDDFRKQLNAWILSQPEKIKEELNILDDMILDIIKASKNGKIYYHAKKVIK
jgi:ATP-dependent Zn protease